MKDLPLNSLRALAAVYETGGIRPAGRQLGVTHSAISRHLRELEAWIQVSLFQHSPGRRTLVFSLEGEVLGKAALSCLAELDASVASLREARQANSVTIATTPSFAVRWLLPRLASFQARCNWVEVSVVVDQRPKAPTEEGADISIRMGGRPRSALASQPLMNDRLYPVASKGYWLSAGQPCHPNDLTNLRLLHDRDPNASWATWKTKHGPSSLDVRKGARFTSSDLVLRAAEQGLGVALARHQLAQEAIANGILVRLFGEREVVLPNAYWIILDHGRAKQPAVQEAVDWLISEANN